jgi:hypothetical protein
LGEARKVSGDGKPEERCQALLQRSHDATHGLFSTVSQRSKKSEATGSKAVIIMSSHNKQAQASITLGKNKNNLHL